MESGSTFGFGICGVAGYAVAICQEWTWMRLFGEPQDEEPSRCRGSGDRAGNRLIAALDEPTMKWTEYIVCSRIVESQFVVADPDLNPLGA